MAILTKIKVIGVGGCGNNAVSRMMSSGIQGVDLIAINTDVQALQKIKAHKKIRIGKQLTNGLGTGMNPEQGKLAIQEQKEEILGVLKDSDMIFITAGFGGGTGTGAAPILAEMAKKQRILTIAVVTKPFSFEGSQRMKIAQKGLEELSDKVDTLLVIPNDKVLSGCEYDTKLTSAFWECDDVLRQAVQGITDLILQQGIINVDFADIEAIMKNSGPALFGFGKASGEKRAENAANEAIHSPFLDFSIVDSNGILFNISGGEDMSLSDIDEVANIITKKVNPKAKIIFGAVKDKKMQKGEIKVMVIATGFKRDEKEK
ncbi:MAG: cell division protein FtsZ [Patescibacteria group bacterium]|nr:cell division protein FtsZ [Patescibacteria group bacterium]